jgi:NhaP-type Na+/H+ or K+/H+ antiporter
MFFSEFSRGLIVSYHVLEAGWECFEFMGNVLIFSLAGIIVGHICTDEHTLQFVSRYDLGWVLVMWVFSFLTRMLMLALVYPLFKWFRRNEWKDPNQPAPLAEMLVEGWGGLRGAVGLALGMLVRNQSVGTDQEEDGTKLLVIVTGVATLTLLVNATTCTPLLKYLKMTDVPLVHQMAVECIHGKVIKDTKGECKRTPTPPPPPPPPPPLLNQPNPTQSSRATSWTNTACTASPRPLTRR